MNQIGKAVAALQKYHSTTKRGAKPKLIEDDPLVSLVIALKKIPDRTIRPLRVYVSSDYELLLTHINPCLCSIHRPLPHTLYPLETTELCLITKIEKSETKELLQEKKVQGVSKVCPC